MQAVDYALPTPQFTTTANILPAGTGTGTTTTVSTSNATPTYGTPVTLTATVAPASGTTAPTLGSVQFFVTNGGVQTSLGTASTDTTSGANAIFTFVTGASTFQVGQVNAISATYTAGANFTGSASTNAVNETVAKKALTVTGITANSKTVDGTTTATLVTTGAGVTGVISPDVATLVTTGAVGTFASSAVGNNITVTVSGLSLTGAQSADYSLPTPQFTTTANILPATTTSVATTTTVSTTNAAPQYGTVVTLTATVTPATGTAAPSLGSVQFVVTNSGTPTTLGTATTDTTSGANAIFTFVTAPTTFQIGQTNAISATYTAGAGFAGSTSTNTLNETVSKKTLTVTGITANNKTYDGTTAATLVTTGAALSGAVGSDVVTLVSTGAVGVFGTVGPANGIPVTVSGLSLTGAQAANYTLPVPQETTTANITGTSATTTIFLDAGASSPLVVSNPTKTVKVFIDAGMLNGARVAFRLVSSS